MKAIEWIAFVRIRLRNALDTLQSGDQRGIGFPRDQSIQLARGWANLLTLYRIDARAKGARTAGGVTFMELLLWRWSTSVQVTSDLIIAIFFVVLARSVRRSELHAWVGGWLANLAALSITIVFWIAQPQSSIAFASISALYLFAKTLFVVLLVAGTAGFLERQRAPVPYRMLVAGVAIFSMLSTLIVHSIDMLGLIQEVMICVCLAIGTALLLAKKPPAYGWLATGFVIRCALAVAESLAFGSQLMANDVSRSQAMATFLASHSSFDTGAEWMIALGCVLMLYRTIQQELIRSNDELRATQQELQLLLNRDQLTGAFNRRSLPTMLRNAQATGATILFFDLDDFKAINDSHGHMVGDECLQRFARVLQESFRVGDHVIRYAGDEFLVIAPGIEPTSVDERIAMVRSHLLSLLGDGPRIDFAVGLAHLPIHGDPEAALRVADEAMYRNKAA